MDEFYIVKTKEKGTVWVYEGTIQGIPLFVKEEEASPLLMSWEEAEHFKMKNNGEYLIERA